MHEKIYTSPMQTALEPNRRPEQTFFADPALDRVLGVLIALATEVHVSNSKIAVMAKALEQNNINIDWEAESNDKEFAIQQRNAGQTFVQHIMDPLLGIQKSKGAT